MSVLNCDVCGGTLSIDAGGKTATCEFCGARHSMERVREKVQEIKGTVSITGSVQARQTGTSEDVEQWKKLLNKYMKMSDYNSAFPVVKKILEAVPTDKEANDTYDLLQELQYFDIRDRVLVKYLGQEKVVKIPEGVKAIAKDAFNGVSIEKLILPDSLEIIHSFAFGYDEFDISRPDWQKVRFDSSLNCIEFGNGLKYIEKFAFCGCRFLTKLIIPDSIIEIEGNAFSVGLKHLVLPKNYIKNADCIYGCESLEIIEASTVFIENAKKTLKSNNPIVRKFPGFYLSPWWKKYQEDKREFEKEERRRQGVCQHCGASFKGLFSKSCSNPNCGKTKDY